MPVASWGYPYNQANKEKFERGFPADFIAEGLDQTRGWFYTLTVLSSALFDQPAFKNCVVNGIILAEDGRKMSKRLKNYPDPMQVLGEQGADALRLYLINSPVVKAQDLSFSEKGVRDIVRRILLRWWNAYSFFVSYANIDQFEPQGDAQQSPNILDQWILSRLNSLTLKTNEEMQHYRLYNVVPALLQFIDELTNTYIRFNRRHFWQEGMPEDKRLAYETLYQVLQQLSRLMAPFTPFMAEMIHQNLSQKQRTAKTSVHLESYPQGDPQASRPELEVAVERMEKLTLMARNLREKLNIKGKIPLKTLRIIHRDPAALTELKKLESYFSEEINIREVIYDSNEDEHVLISAKANFQKLGKKLGKKMKPVAQAVAALSVEEILAIEKGQSFEAAGETLSMEDLEIRRQSRQDKAQSSFANLQDLSIELDPTVEADQIQEGLAREMVRRIQMARKNADFNLDDRIELQLHCRGDLLAAAQAFGDYIQSETLAEKMTFETQPQGEYTEDFEVDGAELKVGLRRVNS